MPRRISDFRAKENPKAPGYLGVHPISGGTGKGRYCPPVTELLRAVDERAGLAFMHAALHFELARVFVVVDVLDLAVLVGLLLS